MKFFYIGPLFDGSTSLDRLKALDNLGVETEPFDSRPYMVAGSRARRSIGFRFNVGPSVKKLNHDLMRVPLAPSEGITHVWVDKGNWVWPSTLRALRERTGAPLVHFTPDPQFNGLHKSRHFFKSVPIYDLLITRKPYELEAYKEYGARNILLVEVSYEKTRFFPREVSEEDQKRLNIKSDVCFIGHCEKHYAKCIRPLTESGINVKVWGPGWARYARLHPWARKAVVSNGIWGEEYCEALCCADIALGLLCKWYPDEITGRFMEIAASGTFLLAERTDNSKALFEEGREAEFFSTYDELREKAVYYLAHPEERKRIAAAGRQRCIRDGYSHHDRLMEMLKAVRRIGDER